MHADTDTGAAVTARALALCESARARADAATPGPWEAAAGSAWQNGQRVDTEHFVRRPDDDVSIAADVYDPVAEEPSAENAAFIAHARADVPLLAAIAAAAVRLWDRANLYEDAGDGHSRCLGCGALFLGADSDGHYLDCPVGALDAAIRAAGEAGT